MQTWTGKNIAKKLLVKLIKVDTYYGDATGTKKLIYKSFVRCHLLNGLIVWGPVPVKHENLKKLYKGYTTNLARDMSTQIGDCL
jgi:hypothetical protein